METFKSQNILTALLSPRGHTGIVIFSKMIIWSVLTFSLRYQDLRLLEILLDQNNYNCDCAIKPQSRRFYKLFMHYLFLLFYGWERVFGGHSTDPGCHWLVWVWIPAPPGRHKEDLTWTTATLQGSRCLKVSHWCWKMFKIPQGNTLHSDLCGVNQVSPRKPT